MVQITYIIKLSIIIFFIYIGNLKSISAQENDLDTQNDTAFPENDSSATSLEEYNQPITLSGLLRNDSTYARFDKNTIQRDYFSNLLEARLILERKRIDWNFYTDMRLYRFEGGDKMGIQKAQYDKNQAKLMRAFLRYFSSIGDFTIGKLYINAGNSGIFNPFELDKSFQFSDLQYAREGFSGIEYSLPWNLNNFNLFTATGKNFKYEPVAGYNPIYGTSLQLHFLTIDAGMAMIHTDRNNNRSGLFFKGDMILGVQGSYAAHIDDKIKFQYSEANAGIDYSFYSGKITTTLLYYYNEKGARNKINYQMSAESFLKARDYILLSGVYQIDEFWNIQLPVFINIVDQSTAVIPSLTTLLSGGLSVNVQLPFFTGKTSDEFSNTRNSFTLLLRVEGKF